MRLAPRQISFAGQAPWMIDRRGIEFFDVYVGSDLIQPGLRIGFQWYLFFLQTPSDIVGTFSFHRVIENPAHDPRGVVVNQQVISVLRIYPVSERCKASGKLPFLRFCGCEMIGWFCT